VSAANSLASSSSSTKRIRFLSLLEFIIPFVRSVGLARLYMRVASENSFSSLLGSQRNQREKWEKTGRCHSSIGLQITLEVEAAAC
jgi:hypothetical protein